KGAPLGAPYQPSPLTRPTNNAPAERFQRPESTSSKFLSHAEDWLRESSARTLPIVARTLSSAPSLPTSLLSLSSPPVHENERSGERESRARCSRGAHITLSGLMWRHRQPAAQEPALSPYFRRSAGHL